MFGPTPPRLCLTCSGRTSPTGFLRLSTTTFSDCLTIAHFNFRCQHGVSLKKMQTLNKTKKKPTVSHFTFSIRSSHGVISFSTCRMIEVTAVIKLLTCGSKCNFTVIRSAIASCNSDITLFLWALPVLPAVSQATARLQV